MQLKHSNPSHRSPCARRSQRGIGLFDSLVALAMLAFGLVGLTQFQARVVAQGTESQTRLTATRLGDELLNMALIDFTNAACYTFPAAGACGQATARAYTDAWAARAARSLPGNDKVEAVLQGGGNQLRVTLTWASKNQGEPVHEMQGVIDVRGP
jgi:type IV pilus assembly protein PilV